MVIFSKLGLKGNLGNQLFQIAATIGIAEKNNHEYCFPYWKYSSYFRKELPQKILGENDLHLIKENFFSYENYILGPGNYNLNGWFQSERYFDVKKTREQFEFEESLVNKIRDRYSFLVDSPHILISVRRGDFLNHPYYAQLSYKYYFLAIIDNFPDWKTRNLIFTSDDIDYCKIHFSFLSNSYFLDDLNAIEQLVFGSLSKDFIISNSTFSWWLAWLGEKKNSFIIRPEKIFRGSFAQENSDKDYFPERWISFKDTRAALSLEYLNLTLTGEFFRGYNYLKYFLNKQSKSVKNVIKQIVRW